MSAFNIPAGFALVPLEPTVAMKRAGLAERHDDLSASIYKAMIAAAPAPPVDAVPGEPVATPVAKTPCGGFDGEQPCHYSGPCCRDASDGRAPAATVQGGVIHWQSEAARHATPEGSYLYRHTLAASVASRAGSEPVALNLFKAVQKFRNEPALERLMGLRKTEGYSALVEAWDDMNDHLASIAPAAAAEPSEPTAEVKAALHRALLKSVQVLPDRERAASLVASEGMVLVPREVLQAASKSLGSFVSEEGWSQQDMDVMDSIDAVLAARASAGEAQS